MFKGFLCVSYAKVQLERLMGGRTLSKLKCNTQQNERDSVS